MNYWIIVTTPEDFQITRAKGFTIEALRSKQRRKVQRVEPGDRILYYISGIRTFAATAIVTSHYFEDHTPIWNAVGHNDTTYRVHIKPNFVLDEKQYIDGYQVGPRLEYVRRWIPEEWHLALQGNLHLAPKKDFLFLEGEMRKIKAKDRRPRSSRGPHSTDPTSNEDHNSSINNVV